MLGEIIENEKNIKAIEFKLLNDYPKIKDNYNNLYKLLQQEEDWKTEEVLNLMKKIDKLLFCFKKYLLYLPFKKSFKKPVIETDYTLRLNYFYEFILTTVYEVFEAFTKYWKLKTSIEIKQNNWFKFINFLKKLEEDGRYNIQIDNSRYSKYWTQRGSITHSISPNTEDYIWRIQSMNKNNEFKEQTDYGKIAELVENIFWDIISLIKEIKTK